MADALLSIPLQIAFEKLARVLGEQIGLYAGAARELRKIRDTFQTMKACLRDAESKQVADERVHLWLSKLKAIAHDIEDVLDEWRISGLENKGSDDDDDDKVRTCFPSPCACFSRSASRYKIASQIKEIRDKLDQIAEDQKLFNFINGGEATPLYSRPQTGVLIEESGIIGRDRDKETVISRLVSGSSSGDGDGRQVHVTAIVGIGGLGKTTLAQQVYNDGKVQEHFNQGLYFVCVPEVFDVIILIKAILEQVKGTSTSLSGLPSLQQELRRSLGGKRFLLVLDDVWNDDADKWELLRLSLTSGAHGSRILVTTRIRRVANIMNAAHVHELQGLSAELSWTLFNSRAFAGRAAEEYSELESVGRKIVTRCGGVPLSIKVMGSTMNSKRTRADWQNILDSPIWSLPQVADKILPALMLSYYNLPPHLKQCFAYCSIYQKDTGMEKDDLVKLWLAQGFIRPEGNREMEDIAEEYFNDLVACSMLQQVLGGTEFQMHDLLHDLAEFIMKDESYIFASENSHNQCPVNVRHASLFLSEDNPRIPIAPLKAKKLRTLFVHGLNENGTILDDFLHEARFLRALLFRECYMKKPPETMGKLKHLRYLDLSDSNIVELPESMSHLVNLHTLNLNNCTELKKLPIGIGRMVSLRHLQIDGTYRLDCLPKGLGRIVCLQSLCKFIVGSEGGCGIDELQRLNALQGSLQIEHLERVSSKEEAEKAELWNKPHLRELDFWMSSGGDEEIVMSGRNDAKKERMENVLDGLRPHPNLEELGLHCTRNGSKLKLPSWMEHSSFSKLTRLVIHGFSQCEGLGKLPALKYLELSGVGMRKMGDEFYYGMSSNDVVGKRRGVAFPKLESLSLRDMNKLKEWELAPEADDAPNVMPSLRQLEIQNCPELQVLPPHLAYAPLAKLKIENCDKIEGVRCSSFPLLEDFTLVESSEFFSSCLPDLPNLKKFKIDKLRNETLPNGGWERLVTLQELEISHCNELKCLPDGLTLLQSLERLQIIICERLESLPHSLGHLKALKDFAIEGAEALTCLPDSLGQLESLEDLAIRGCSQLVSLPHSLGHLKALKDFAIVRAEALTSLPDSLGQLESLKTLAIFGCQKLVSLPHSLRHLKALQYFAIGGAEALTCLPDSLGQLESLEDLTIRDCSQLVSLPHSLGHLKALKDFAIVRAEALTSLPDSLGQLESLKTLAIIGCQKLVSLPHSLKHLKALEDFAIEGAEALTCLPDSLGQLESLENLAIRDCSQLVSLPHSLGHLKALKHFAIEGAEAFACLPDSLGQLESLLWLRIHGCQKLVSLPHSLGHLKALSSFGIEGAEALTCLPDSLGQLESLLLLRIRGCPQLVSLPHSLGQLKALNILYISNCEAVESLPHALQDLSQLQELNISSCPLLSERCKREGGEDWPKISHIRTVYIDGEYIETLRHP